MLAPPGRERQGVGYLGSIQPLGAVPISAVGAGCAPFTGKRFPGQATIMMATASTARPVIRSA